MLPDYINDNKDFLQKIARTKSNKRFLQLVKNANNDQLLAIVDICFNILKGNLNLKNRKRAKLSVNKDYYRSIAKARSAKTARNRIQTGGSAAVLGAVIAPVLGALAQSLLDKALSKNETH